MPTIQAHSPREREPLGLNTALVLSVVAHILALLATMAGLLVAIPASVGYNAFTGFSRRAEAAMYHFGSELVSLFKRGDLSALEKSAANKTAKA